jgi:hypothetical protein
MRKKAILLALIASLTGVAALFKGYYASASDWERYKGSVDFYEASSSAHSQLGSFTSLGYPKAPNEPTELEKMIALVSLSSAGLLFIVGFLAGSAKNAQ